MTINKAFLIAVIAAMLVAVILAFRSCIQVQQSEIVDVFTFESPYAIISVMNTSDGGMVVLVYSPYTHPLFMLHVTSWPPVVRCVHSLPVSISRAWR